MSGFTQKLFFLDGVAFWLTPDEIAALSEGTRKRASPGTTAGYSEGKPGKSISMGCHRSQASLLNDTMKAHGVRGVEWDRDGTCRITSRRARARAMKVLGPMLNVGPLHDRDGGYGDG